LLSPLRQTFERSEKPRAGNHCRIRSMNDSLAFRPQGCHRKCHRNAVIAKRIYFRSA
jgi:hypothetical protein